MGRHKDGGSACSKKTKESIIANLREVTGRSCVSHNLGMSEWSERDVDRVAALGAVARELDPSKVGDLGIDLWRWAYALDPRAARSVWQQLSVLLKSKFHMTEEQAGSIAKQSMREFVDWACPVCAGRRHEQLFNGIIIDCEACRASGLKRYTDSDRREGTGINCARVNYRALVEKPIEYALGILRAEDARVNQRLNKQLGRGGRA